jgi:hypothetical protein
VKLADIDRGQLEGVTSAQLAELAQLRKRSSGVARRARHPQVSDGCEGDPVNVFPCIETEKVEQRNVVKAGELLKSLPVRLYV